jgi:hypothetical protein
MSERSDRRIRADREHYEDWQRNNPENLPSNLPTRAGLDEHALWRQGGKMSVPDARGVIV